MVIQFIIIGILTLINAFFASAEMAMVSLNKNKVLVMAEEGNQKAKRLMKLLEEPSKFLATIQVGITLAGFFSSAFAATGLSVGLGVFLTDMKVPYANKIALVIVTIALSFVMLLLGELFPKRLALQKAQSIAMFSITPIYYIAIVTKPFVKLLSLCTNALIGLVGIDQKDLDQKVSEEEIRSMITVGQELGVINQTEKEMINSIFEFDDKLARSIMTPRIDMMMVDISQPYERVIEALVQLKYSRIPIYEGDKDKIIGIIHTKNLLVQAREKGFEAIDIKKVAVKPYFVPETVVIDQLFIQMQRAQQHIAILMDEHGLATGLVTMEDLIEEVMGEIEDEFDLRTDAIIEQEDGSYKVKGSLNLFEFNTFFHTTLSDVDADTIGGYVISALGTFPKKERDNYVKIEGLNIIIDGIESHRVTTLTVKKE